MVYAVETGPETWDTRYTMWRKYCGALLLIFRTILSMAQIVISLVPMHILE